MPPDDFVRCWLFDKIEPLGDRRGDLQAAMVVAAIANLFTSKEKEGKNPYDFLPDWDGIFRRLGETPEQKAAREMKKMLILQQVQNAIVAAQQNP